MELKIVETSLNLRVERRLGKENKDYLLSKDVAEEQLKLNADVYCNVEYMECFDKKYMEAFETAGYTAYKALDSYNQRGVMYMVKNEYQVKIVGMFEEPHMMHIQLIEDGTIFNIITVRILVSGGNDADYQSRKEQWDKILNYIDRLENKDNLCITGDFNHGVICEEYSEEEARRFYNYQMVVDTLGEKNISLADIDGTSYKGYMKVDHLATTNDLKVIEAEYLDVFGEHKIIGLPDHSMIVATVERV